MSRVRVLVPISGGKDSQACLKLALETGKSPWTSKGGKARNEGCALMCGD